MNAFFRRNQINALCIHLLSIERSFLCWMLFSLVFSLQIQPFVFIVGCVARCCHFMFIGSVANDLTIYLNIKPLSMQWLVLTKHTLSGAITHNVCGKHVLGLCQWSKLDTVLKWRPFNYLWMNWNYWSWYCAYSYPVCCTQLWSVCHSRVILFRLQHYTLWFAWLIAQNCYNYQVNYFRP